MIFTIFAILIAVEIIISYKCLTVTDYKIKSDKIKETTKIVLISDLHNSQFGSKNKRLVDKIQKQDPDLILMEDYKPGSSSSDLHIYHLLTYPLCRYQNFASQFHA